MNPTHVVEWKNEGLHSSINPSQWVGGLTQTTPREENKPLKEPIIPYKSEAAMLQAKSELEQKAREEAENARKSEYGSGELFESGKATYYAASMHGRRTADGSRYDKNAFTCAHRTLPFGTKIRVVNKKNGKETVVKVTDRGPYGKGKVIDLSNSAAAALDMVSAGIVPVDLYVISR